MGRLSFGGSEAHEAIGVNSDMILGIDPGLANCGWAVLEKSLRGNKLLECGCITNKSGGKEERIKLIYEELVKLIEKYQIKTMAVEKLFFFKNAKSVMEVAQVIGALKLLAAERGLEFFEYTPLQVKMSLVGYGRAEKMQVEKMVRNMLGLKENITPSHASDAVAIGLTHIYTKRW